MIVLRRPAINLPITSANVVVADTLGGLQDGSNFTYTTTFDYKPSRIHVSYNGQMLSSPDDFIESDTNGIQFNWIRPKDDDVIRATYETTVSGGELSPLSGRSAVIGDIQNISFGQTLNDTDYKLVVTLFTTDTSPSIYGYIITDKTTSGFTVEFSGEIDTGNYTLEWMVTNY